MPALNNRCNKAHTHTQLPFYNNWH
uniref:Uncharacterized protein n=1 Tax=Anguilla anguilla TaxID=7936 RepID=A0A0E9U8K7_ANGAN